MGQLTNEEAKKLSSLESNSDPGEGQENTGNGDDED